MTPPFFAALVRASTVGKLAYETRLEGKPSAFCTTQHRIGLIILEWNRALDTEKTFGDFAGT